MDTLSAFRYLASHTEIMDTIEQIEISELDRLLVLALAFQEAGFPCDVRLRGCFFRADEGHSQVSTLQALFMPSADGTELCVKMDGAEGDEAVLQRCIEDIRRKTGRLDTNFNSFSEWRTPKKMARASSGDIYPGTQRGENCQRLLEMVARNLMAFKLGQATEQVIHAPGSRPRI